MAIDNSFLIKKILSRDHFYAAFCAVTGMPFAVCDPVTFEDQVWIFSDEGQYRNFAERYAGRKIALRCAQVKRNSYLGFLGTLYTLGIGEVVFTENDASAKIPLDQMVKRQDISKIPPAMRPFENPQLQLTGLYLMQEVGRQVPNEEKEDLAQLDEEFTVNLARSRFGIAVELNNGPGTPAEKLQKNAFSVPVINLKNGDRYRPLFTDMVEFNKFRSNAGNKPYQMLQVPFAALKAMLPKDVKGYILNPAGFHILLQSATVDRVLARFPDEVKQGAEEFRKAQEKFAGPQVKKMGGKSTQGGAPSLPHSKITRMPEKDGK